MICAARVETPQDADVQRRRSAQGAGGCLPGAIGGTPQLVSTLTPPLTVQELPGRVRLWLGTLSHGTGATLQDAADDLVQRLLDSAMALRTRGLPASSELGPPDPAAVGLLYELGEIAASGGDIRSRLFG
jgi:hypothetical protein